MAIAAPRSPGDPRGDGQPPITPATGLFSSDWLPGPEVGPDLPVVVSFTDFRANTDDELAEIFRTGLELGQNWPIMNGAVGLWLWGKPSELRGGSVSVWRTDDDLRRFVRWPVHAAIIKAWRSRIEVRAQRWADASFDPEHAWLRAEEHMRIPREMSDG
jgi:hypothetical protein